MSPAAVALAIGLHALVAAGLWWAASWQRDDHAETPIMVSFDPQPLAGGGGAPAGGSQSEMPSRDPTETAAPAPAQTSSEAHIPASPQTTPQAAPPPPTPAPADEPAATPPPREAARKPDAAPAPEPTPADASPPGPDPQQAETAAPSRVETETAWQTEASAWKPQVTLELPPPDAPPPPTSRELAKPTPRPQAARPTAPPRPPPPAAPRAAPPQNTGPLPTLAAPSQNGTPGQGMGVSTAPQGHGGERNDYLSRVFRHIEPFRAYPEAARVNRQRGRVVTRVTINRMGELIAISIDRSSGWPLIDRAELAAIQRAMPLPPVPAGMQGDPIVLILPMTYNYEGR